MNKKPIQANAIDMLPVHFQVVHGLGSATFFNRSDRYRARGSIEALAGAEFAGGDEGLAVDGPKRVVRSDADGIGIAVDVEVQEGVGALVDEATGDHFTFAGLDGRTGGN